MVQSRTALTLHSEGICIGMRGLFQVRIARCISRLHVCERMGATKTMNDGLHVPIEHIWLAALEHTSKALSASGSLCKELCGAARVLVNVSWVRRPTFRATYSSYAGRLVSLAPIDENEHEYSQGSMQQQHSSMVLDMEHQYVRQGGCMPVTCGEPEVFGQLNEPFAKTRFELFEQHSAR